MSREGSSATKAGRSASATSNSAWILVRITPARGSLVPRRDPRALLEDPAEAAAQAVSLATRATVTAVDDGDIAIMHDTICVHADMRGAVARLIAIREALTELGIELVP